MSTITNIMAEYNRYRKFDESNQLDYSEGDGSKVAIPSIEIRCSSVYPPLALKIERVIGIKQNVPN